MPPSKARSLVERIVEKDLPILLWVGDEGHTKIEGRVTDVGPREVEINVPALGPVSVPYSTVFAVQWSLELLEAEMIGGPIAC